MFRRKLAQAIVKARYILTVCILAAAAICCTTISKTRINYDMNRYLSDDTMTKRALVVMEQEFGSAEQLRIMFTDRTEQQLEEYVAALNTAPEVMLAAHDPESGVIRAEGRTFQLATVALDECDSAAAVRKLRTMFPEAGKYWVGGSAASLLDIQESVGEEIPVVMAIAVAVVLIMLLVTSRGAPVSVLLVLSLLLITEKFQRLRPELKQASHRR